MTAALPLEGWVTTDDGVELYYSTIGTGPQVVVVPGGFYFEKAFEPLTRGRTFVLLHQRGRGRSEVPDGATQDIPHEAMDLETVRRGLGIDRWSLVGWSYAGMVTALYAIDHPDHVERLVHLCSLGPDEASYRQEADELQGKTRARTDPDDWRRLEEMDAQGLRDSDPATYAAQLARVIVGRQLANRDVLQHVPFESCRWPNEWLWRTRPEWSASFQAWDQRDRLPSIRAPMLVVYAAEDLIPYRAARDMAAVVPDARLFTIEGSGHWPWLERPDVFFPAVDTFLAGEWPEGAEVVR